MAGYNGSSIEIGQSDQELVGSGKKMDIKKIAAFTFIGVIIVGLAVTAIVVLIVNDDKNDYNPFFPDPLALTLDDILTGRLIPRRFNGTWMSDREIIYRNEIGDLTITDVITMQRRTLDLAEEQAQGVRYDISSTGKYLLVTKKYQKVFRHGSLAEYDILDLTTKAVTTIKVDDKDSRLSLVLWSPVGDGLAFVFNNNIYYKPSPTEKEIAITKDGSVTFYNGLCDWVYEEEVFGSNAAMFFSPDGTKLAYVTFDDTNTRKFDFPIYGIPGDIQDQYPTTVTLAYPKAGSPNPVVYLRSVVLSGDFTINNLTVPEPLADVDHLITSTGWANNDTVVAIWMNRIQNNAYFQKCTGSNCNVFHNINSTSGWLEFASLPTFNRGGDWMAIISSQDQGGSIGSYQHLTLVKVSEADSAVALTRGRYVVKQVLKWDAETNLIFYIANTETDTNAQHVFAIKGDAGASPICITCDVKYEGAEENEKNSYFSATFASGSNYMVLHSNGPSVPRADIFLWEFANNIINLKPVDSWEKNEDLTSFLKVKKSPIIEIHDIELDSGVSTRVKLMLPPNVNRTGVVKYPMIIEVYGGPKTNVVVDEFDLDWGSFMASNNIVYAKIDGRGSGLRGDAILHAIYRRLGTVEVEDQIKTAQKLKQKLGFIDEKKSAVWGWSYGGFASAMSLVRDTENVFQCAVSVAPVTDWTYYDSIYTERYMTLPKDNPEGYFNSTLSTMYEPFRNKKYMLIHGTGDDNVHYQQSMALARTLELNDVLFKETTYPDEDHGLIHVRPHLYHSLARFFDDCFKVKTN